MSYTNFRLSGQIFSGFSRLRVQYFLASPKVVVFRALGVIPCLFAPVGRTTHNFIDPGDFLRSLPASGSPVGRRSGGTFWSRFPAPLPMAALFRVCVQQQLPLPPLLSPLATLRPPVRLTDITQSLTPTRRFRPPVPLGRRIHRYGGLRLLSF